MPWKNPEDQAAYQKRYLATPEGKAKHKAAADRNRKQNSEFRIQLLNQFPCYCCGNPDPTVIDWHHVVPEDKTFEIKWGIHLSHEKWWNEVLKCIPVCCNCHRKIHKNTLCLLPPTFHSE